MREVEIRGISQKHLLVIQLVLDMMLTFLKMEKLLRLAHYMSLLMDHSTKREQHMFMETTEVVGI